MATRLVEIIAQVALLVLTARLMEPDGRGLYALASFAALLVGLPLGSVWTANAIEIARGRMRPGEVLGASLAIAAAGGLAVGATGVAVSSAFGDRWWVLAIPASVAPFILLARYVEGMYQALGDVRAVNAMVLGRVLLAICFVAPPLLVGAGDAAAIGSWCLSLVALALLGVWTLHRRVGRMRVPRGRDVYRRLVGVGLKLAAGSSAMLVTPRIALVVLAAFATTADVGVYSVAIAVSEMLYLAVYALDLGAFHGISTRRESEAAALTTRAYRHAVVMVLVGAVVLIPASVAGLSAVVGEGYEDVPLLLAVLVPGAVAQAVGRLLFAYFAVRRENPGLVTAVVIVMAVVNIPLTLALVPLFGTWGAAVASSAAAVLANGVLTWRFLRETNAPATRLIPGSRELRDYMDLATMLGNRLRGRSA